MTLITGTLDFGMGHATPFAQVLSEKLGIPFAKISLVQGDSDRLAMGGGSGGSKSLMHSGTAIIEAAAKVVEKGKEAAGHVLEAAVSDIEFAHGCFVIAGTDRSISVMDLARFGRDEQFWEGRCAAYVAGIRTGKRLRPDEHADDYVRRLREGWE